MSLVIMMPQFRLKPPHPYAPGQSRPILSVMHGGRSQGYAIFRNGSYEFEISDRLYENIICDEAQAVFEMQGEFPVAILIEEKRDQ